MSRPLLQSEVENRLLARLTPADFALLDGLLEPVACPVAMTLVHPDVPMPDVFFLESGVASIVVLSPEGEMAEGGIVGREGFVSPSIMLGSDQIPYRIEMQMPGRGNRIARTDLLASASESPSLHQTLLLFANVMSVQTGYTVLANAIQTIEQRLARWLLMCHDRSSSDDLALTHRFMAVMLSVRRASVTQALHILESRGSIETARGYVTIRNRPALEDFAGDSYGQPEAEYRRLLGPL